LRQETPLKKIVRTLDGAPERLRVARLAKHQQLRFGIFIPTFALKSFFIGFERILYIRLVFLINALPGAADAVYQLYMIKKYIALFRVSTDKQGIDGNGMESQRQIVRRYVDSQNGTIEREFSEVVSGCKTDTERPQLAAALEYTKKNKAT
jgi:hypothetical protein